MERITDVFGRPCDGGSRYPGGFEPITDVTANVTTAGIGGKFENGRPCNLDDWMDKTVGELFATYPGVSITVTTARYSTSSEWDSEWEDYGRRRKEDYGRRRKWDNFHKPFNLDDWMDKTVGELFATYPGVSITVTTARCSTNEEWEEFWQRQEERRRRDEEEEERRREEDRRRRDEEEEEEYYRRRREEEEREEEERRRQEEDDY